MSYRPGPDDIRCVKCQEWYHKALKACPICDTLNTPLSPPPPATAPTPQYISTKGAWTKFLQWVERNPKQALWVLLAPILILGITFCVTHPIDDTDKRKFHDEISALVTSDKVYVRPYNPSLDASITVVVPVMTSEREAQEIGLSLQKYAHQGGVSIFFHIETPAGQRLATVGP